MLLQCKFVTLLFRSKSPLPIKNVDALLASSDRPEPERKSVSPNTFALLGYKKKKELSIKKSNGVSPGFGIQAPKSANTTNLIAKVNPTPTPSTGINNPNTTQKPRQSAMIIDKNLKDIHTSPFVWVFFTIKMKRKLKRKRRKLQEKI